MSLSESEEFKRLGSDRMLPPKDVDLRDSSSSSASSTNLLPQTFKASFNYGSSSSLDSSPLDQGVKMRKIAKNVVDIEASKEP